MNETAQLGIETLVNIINSSGGIPLMVTSTSTTNYTQWITTILVSSVVTLFFFGKIFGGVIKQAISKIGLFLFKEKNNLGNIIVIKHTEQGLFGGSMISRITLEKIQRALIKAKGKPIDLILYTPGGEIFSATYISRLFKKYPGKIRSIIPTFSMSGGTLLALSTDEIYMNDYACLGAVDPQLGNLFRYGSANSYKEILKIKGKKADDQTIAFKMMGEQYTKSIRENIEMLLEGKTEKKKIKHLSKILTSGELEHGFNMTKDFLRFNGLDIKNLNNNMNDKIIKLIKSLPQGVSYI